MAKKVGVLVELDYCVGCSACQLSCQGYYDLPVTETYMRVFLSKPDVVDGHHEMFMSPYAYRLDKCAYCLEKEEGNAPCAAICISRALHVGELEEMKQLAAKTEGRLALYS